MLGGKDANNVDALLVEHIYNMLLGAIHRRVVNKKCHTPTL
jgi:hypothetical protein